MGVDWVINYGFETVVITVVGYLLNNARKQGMQYKATQSGVKALLRDRLISAMHKAKKQGYIYIHEHENIDNMFKEYVNLGGNGTIVHLMKEISKLPMKTDIN